MRRPWGSRNLNSATPPGAIWPLRRRASGVKELEPLSASGQATKAAECPGWTPCCRAVSSRNWLMAAWQVRSVRGRKPAVVSAFSDWPDSTQSGPDASAQSVEQVAPHDVEPDDEISMRFTGVRYTDLRGSLGRLSDKGKTMSFSTPATPAMSSPAHAPATAPTSTGSPPTSPVPRPASSCSVPRPAGSSRWRAQRLATVLHPGAAGGVRRQVRPPAALAPGRGPADLARPTRQGTQQRRAEPDDAITVQGIH